MNTTLDEWEILYAVVQLGGFAAAAQHLNRSQSTISYAIGRLQDRLGVQLFEIKGRKAELTEAGRVLLGEAEPHLAGFRELEQRALVLAQGGACEVRLAVDSIFPAPRLFAALAEFARTFPYVQLKLRQCPFLSADSEFSLHHAHICVTGLRSRGFFAQPLLDIKVLAVARHDHPLHALKRRLGRADLQKHVMATIEGNSSGIRHQQPRSPAQRYLPLSSIEGAIEAVRSGICFGHLPEYRIRAELDSGELLPLRLPAGQSRVVRLDLVCRDLGASGKEVTLLAELLGLNREPESV